VRIVVTKNKKPIDWLFPEVRKKVLSLLLDDPNQSWYLRDIARKTDCALGTVRRELAGLAKTKIVIKNKDGNRTYYRVNTACSFFPELTGLLRKTTGVVDVLQSALRPISKKVKVAFIYGSFAKGSEKTESDLDLIVIGSCSFEKVIDVLADTQSKIGRDVNPTVCPITEWRNKIIRKNHFVTSVLKSHKIFLIGDADDLAGIAD